MQQARRQSLQQPKGFTLVELLIVIVVIAILAAISVVAYRGVANNAKAAALKANLSQMSQKLEVYRVDTGSYSADLATAGLKSPGQDGTIYNYQQSSSAYCLSATRDSISYRLTNSNTAPTEGTCSGVLADGSTCPSGFIVVPANPSLGTPADFCTMKYEAKIQGNDNGTQTYSAAFVPESRASGTPWVNISQTNALAEASTVSGCPTCHLISEAEWMTIAANVLSVPSNWSGGTVGSGYIYQGHINNNPASALDAPTDDTDGLNGMTGTGGAGANNRRTLTLTNGEVIWDLSGNLWECTQGTITGGAQPGLSGESAYAWKQWNNPSLLMNGLPTLSQPSALASQPGLAAITGWSLTQGIGQLYSNYGETALHAFQRGGTWGNTSHAGVLALNLNSAPSGADTYLGFRVSR